MMTKIRVLPFLRCVLVLGAMAASAAGAAPGEFKVAAQTFGVLPEAGSMIGGQHDTRVTEVHSDLQTTLFLFEQAGKRHCLITSHLGGAHRGQLREVIIELLGRELGVERHAVVICGSHNHCVAPMNHEPPADASDTARVKAHKLYLDFVAKLRAAARSLPAKLEPATVAWGTAEETRITYNRKGRYPDGRTYFVREEDRVKLGEGYTGLIDPTASVVALRRRDNSIIACLTFFTGHPVTAYHPERQIVFGEWPQVACEKLSRELGGIPVGFVQGCAGDINSKHMLEGSVEKSRLFGDYLGSAFIIAAKSLRPSKRTGMEWQRVRVDIPMGPLPPLASLEKDLAELEDFMRRGNAGDENTFSSVGMNFPHALTPPFRARTAGSVRPWYLWAIAQHRAGTAGDVMKALPLQIVVARLGDVGFVGLPWEPFVATGLKIKREAALPHVLTAGYTEGQNGYIPDASGTEDREYMSGNYRYSSQRMRNGGWPPYKPPAGDAAAILAVEILAKMAD